MSCVCILFFAIQRHLFQNFGTIVGWNNQSSAKDDFQAPLGTPRFSFFSLQILQILQITDTRSALSQSQKARRVAVTVIRSCEATREARSGTRRMTVPFPSSRSAPSQSQKARRIEGTVIRSCIATRVARSGALRMTVHYYLRHTFCKKVRWE